MFIGLNLLLQWVPGVENFPGETQKCHLVEFHWVCYRGVYCTINSPFAVMSLMIFLHFSEFVLINFACRPYVSVPIDL